MEFSVYFRREKTSTKNVQFIRWHTQVAVLSVVGMTYPSGASKTAIMNYLHMG